MESLYFLNHDCIFSLTTISKYTTACVISLSHIKYKYYFRCIYTISNDLDVSKFYNVKYASVDTLKYFNNLYSCPSLISLTLTEPCYEKYISCVYMLTNLKQLNMSMGINEFDCSKFIYLQECTFSRDYYDTKCDIIGLENLSYLSSLNIDYLHFVRNVSNLIHLKHLYIGNEINNPDEPLKIDLHKIATNLISFSCMDSKISNELILSMTNLTHLCLRTFSFNLSLTHLIELISLKINGHTISKINLSHLPNLKFLTIGEINMENIDLNGTHPKYVFTKDKVIKYFKSKKL